MADGGVRRGKRKAGLPGLCWKTCYFHLLFWVVCVSGDDKTLIVECLQTERESRAAPPVAVSDYTYFYKGREYWKFDNKNLAVEPGYPKSILRDWMGCDQSGMERSGGGGNGNGNRGDRQLPPDDVDIMVTINDVPTTVNAIAVVIPCILSLCILVLVYTIFQFKNKGAQQTAVPHDYYKYPVQEWV
ncbi:unnamed protein product [Boreogadus saida]